MIGGRLCNVKASYVNGMVSGWVGTDLSSQKHVFEFEPLKSLRKKPLIIAEVYRLYWEYFPTISAFRDPKGRKGIQLCFKDE